MQVSRIGLPQMMFPGFQPAHVESRRRPFAGGIPAVTRPVNRGALLGQADQTKKPLSIPFDDAQKMLTSAEGIIAQYPACNLPVIERFRTYVRAGSKATNLELSASDATDLDQFSLCAETKGQKGGKTSDAVGLVVGGVAAAAILGILLWNW